MAGQVLTVATAVETKSLLGRLLLDHSKVKNLLGVGRGKDTSDAARRPLRRCCQAKTYPEAHGTGVAAAYDYAKQRIECWLNGVAAIHCNIAMKDFLEHFCIGDQTLAVAQ